MAEVVADHRLLHDIPHACQVTSLGRTTMYELMARGEIEFVHLGRRRLIPHASLEAFVQRLANGEIEV